MLSLPLTSIAPMAANDKQFYARLGHRIAELRHAQALTQAELADAMGVSQQTLAHYENGRARIQVARLPAVAKALGVSVEELIGTASKPGKRGPAPRLQQQLERLSKLPRSKQRFVSEMLDTVLKQAN